jgi:hypothetical protein
MLIGIIPYTIAYSSIMTDNLEQLRYPIGEFEKPDSHTLRQQQEWIDVLTALPRWLDACIENLDEAQLQTPYRPGGWTVQQVIHHIADSHMNAYVRLKLALTEDNPTIKPYKEALWAELPDNSSVPVNISITLLHALHRRWTATLRALQPEEWLRTYHHPESNRDVPLWEMTAMYAWHSRHHMEHIRQLRERMNW